MKGRFFMLLTAGVGCVLPIGCSVVEAPPVTQAGKTRIVVRLGRLCSIDAGTNRRARYTTEGSCNQRFLLPTRSSARTTSRRDARDYARVVSRRASQGGCWVWRLGAVFTGAAL